MINIEINWINEKIRIDDDEKKTYGMVRFFEIDLDQIERTDNLKTDYETVIKNMMDNELINMKEV